MKTRAFVMPVCPPPGPPAPPPPPPQPATVAETFDADGHLAERAEMRGGVLDGTTVFFAPDGREKGRAEFKRGVLDGAMTLRDGQGRVSWSAGYRAGVPHGEMSSWNDGVLAETVPFVEGRRQGTALAWHPDGTTASSLPYVADRLEGTALWFSAGGRKMRSAAYAAGALDGESLDFYPTTPAETVRTRSIYSQGKLNGPVTQYDTAGRALMRAWFTQGDAGWSIVCLWGTLSPSASLDGSPPAPAPIPFPAPAPPAEPEGSGPAAEPVPPVTPPATDPTSSAEPAPNEPPDEPAPAAEPIADPAPRGIWFVPAFLGDQATEPAPTETADAAEDGVGEDGVRPSSGSDADEGQRATSEAEAPSPPIKRSLLSRMFGWTRHLKQMERK